GMESIIALKAMQHGLRPTRSRRRQLVYHAACVGAAAGGCAIDVAGVIESYAAFRKITIFRPCERVQNTLGPAAAGRRQLVDNTAAIVRHANLVAEVATCDRRAIKIARLVEDKPAVGIASIAASGEGVKCVFRPGGKYRSRSSSRRPDAINRAARCAETRRPVDNAIPAQDGRSEWLCPVFVVKGVKSG